ncbi:succinate dehydrogenase/fumarate reductase iron-sulfur subunit [Neoroseomonas oryzicola]|uniref:Succinate dehydrogenase iron-sulfur subunit n=1 Tax=Neoroseomonas oryzicola TaxID=535904 RepID=A0A9X9WH98_9PROT|nr:succinate dehydrogenase/fumarate reductase iron-sulfur subunit [Neoroseomonas oryzicola]MBR0659708.1 succinate dehydrogenase/fumarate reductase iron-sulfur subunit [Neoroseomonas oryzicola]NKE17138.1 succinate dehydrogenase/fumarate reductase iron-sulfur subunit [Neoroseomonas oryzicola]
MAEPASLKVSVWRGGEQGDFARYEVPARANQTVLDVVTHIQRELDPSLAYRFACRVGMCGSCAMTVNGRARWTCRTHVRKVVGADGELELRPLANLPVIRDLAADLAPFFDKWQRAQGRFQPKDAPDGAVPEDFVVVPPASKARREADAGIECIGCAVCYASCDVVAWNPDYLGPAALNRAWTLVNDVRDGAHGDRLDAVAGDAGCHSCHSTQSCTERCPKNLDPSSAIAGLKRRLFWDTLLGRR